MSASIPNGSVFSLATTYGPVLPVTIASNANPAVLTSAGHGLANGDIIEITSGWLGINERIARVAGVAANTFQLEGYDTTNLGKYPIGTGVGSVRKILTWTQIGQVTGSESSGGDQNFVEWVYLEDGRQRRRPTFKNAKGLQLTMADDPSLPWNAVLAAADEDGLARALWLKLASGGSIYYNTFVSFDGEPSLNVNQIMSVVATFSQIAQLKRYAA